MLGALVSGGLSLAGNWLQGKQNYKHQKEFAQNSLQWKAKDAEKAGISKLYAMGAPTVSYAPSNVGAGSGLAQAGQDIGRAVNALESPAGKAGALATELQKAQVESLQIDNNIKRTELASKLVKATQPGTPPAVLDSTTTPVIEGQGNAGVKLKKEIAPASPTAGQRSFGVSPEVDMYRTSTGWSPEVPQQLGEAHESQPLAAVQWFMRNKMLPWVSDTYATNPFIPPEGSYWAFDPLFGQYVLVDPKKRGKTHTEGWGYMMHKLKR